MWSVRWVKVWNDLWGNKIRTLLIVLSIAVGLFAMGTIVSARTILSTGMADSYAAIRPSSGTVRTAELFDEDFLRVMRDVEGVAEADARRSIQVRVEVKPGVWSNLLLFAVPDYDAMRVDKIRPDRGAWPPPDREILIERAALPLIGKQIGDWVVIETANGRERSLRIAGTVHDMSQLPAQFDNSPYGYISFETVAWLGEAYGLNELHIVAADRGGSEAQQQEFARQVVSAVQDRAERSGLTIPMTMTADSGQVPLNDILQAILLLMGMLGLLSLLLSALLIINTISALLAQGRRQIGIMKAIGARSTQIAAMYLGMVILYGLAALLLALPLSLIGARALSRFLAAQLNFDLADVSTPPLVLVLQAGAGLLVPVLASLYPFLTSLRVTAAAAMSDRPTSRGGQRVGQLGRLLSGANLWFARRFLLRTWLLSLRNTFRNPGRLVLTLTTLTLASAIFCSVFSVRASLLDTTDALLQMWQFDAWITFSHPQRIAEIEQQALQVPGTVAVDTWIQLLTRRMRPDGSEGEAIYVFAPHMGSPLVAAPAIVAGRWLVPGDEKAVVVSTILLEKEPDIKLGDEIVLKVEGREQRWQVVGISMGFLIPMAYVTYDDVARLTGRSGQADAALVRTVQRDEAAAQRAAAALETHFERQGMQVGSVQTVAAERQETDLAYGIIIGLLLIMALLLALVGGLGLMGTMSINVLERTREIGVLRAVGTWSREVAWVFIREGVAVGLLSWLLGALLSLPLGRMMADAVGRAMAGTALRFTWSVTGLVLWLGLVVLLSGLASLLPARGASRLTVREVLAYE